MYLVRKRTIFVAIWLRVKVHTTLLQFLHTHTLLTALTPTCTQLFIILLQDIHSTLLINLTVV